MMNDELNNGLYGLRELSIFYATLVALKFVKFVVFTRARTGEGGFSLLGVIALPFGGVFM